MKKIFALFLGMFALIAVSKAQSTTSVIKHSHDFLMVQVSYDSWMGAPDSIKTGGLSRGLNIAFMYDFQFKPGSKLSIAPGLGISSSNIFLKNQTAAIGALSPTLQFPADSSFKHYKLSTNFLEIPIELRFRQYPNNANKGFKAGIGLKFGTLLNAHTKGKKILSGGKQTQKVSDKRYFQTWRAAAIARLGYGNFSVFTSYSLTPLLKQSAGPSLNTFSIGVGLSGL